MSDNLKDIKEYEINPRFITKEKYELLQKTLKEFGDLGGIVVNQRTGEVISGNQRTKTFQENPEENNIVITDTYNEPQKDGTIKRGYIEDKDGLRFSYRVVDWDDDTARRANIAANKAGGFFDYDVLANMFPEDDLLNYGFSPEDLDFMPRETKFDEREQDTDQLKESMTSYLEGNVKQIVLYFKGEEYDAVMERINLVMEEDGFESHTDLFIKVFEDYENNRAN